MTIAKPREALGLPKPLFYRLPRGITALNMAIMVLTCILSVVYIVQVNAATTKGYSLRKVEKKVDALTTETMILHDKIAVMSSIQSLNARAAELNMEPATDLRFLNPAGKFTAMAVGR